MNYPFYIEIGGSRILLHTLAEWFAFFAGFKYFQFLKRKHGDSISVMSRSWVFAGAVFGALIGSRLLGGLENPKALMQSGNWLLYFYENKTVVGGFLGGLFGVEGIKKMIGEKEHTGDLFVKPILLALIIGRVGCFSMGVHEETYGLPVSLPWGMDLGDGITRHPVAIYEIIFLILLWTGISRLERKYILTSGSAFKLFLIAYLLFRFLLDFIKPHVPVFWGLGTIQLACIGGLIYYQHDIRNMNRMIIKKKTSDGGKSLHLL